MPQKGRRYEFCSDLLMFFRSRVCCLWAGKDTWPVTAETGIYEVPCSKQFRILWRKVWMKVESFHSGIGLGLTCASCIQDPIDSNVSIAISIHLLWPAEPGHHQVSYCRKAVELLRSLQIWLSGYTPSSVSMVGRRCWHLIRKVWTTKPSESAQAVLFFLQSETPLRISAKIKINLWFVSFLSCTKWTLQ
jgi:hypothetical protein